MNGLTNWPQAVAAAHATGKDDHSENGVTVRRIRGGANNALYRVDVEGQSFACKLCIDDERQRAAREYGALDLLHRAGLDLAPRPLWLDESFRIFPVPAVASSWLQGVPIGPALTMRQLANLLETIQATHAVCPNRWSHSPLPAAWLHWFDFDRYLIEMQSLIDTYGLWLMASDREGAALIERMQRVLARCAQIVAKTDVNPDYDHVPLCLCHVDPNLANAIWCDDDRLRWVDWEYSGWGDPALALADLRWHAALEGLTDEQHAWLRENYRRPDDDPAFDERLRVWDCILATRWPLLIVRLLWSQHNGPDRPRLSQPAVELAEVRERFVRFIRRAEEHLDWS
ncbi:MAG TPA: aminoglycoside phosphotransferase family protein [Anaerolineae bacterium]|nr:aminoglycoside phosphotransferase family protein [Anaerolineae bacterium]